MPNYKLGSRMFAIPDDKVEAFESQFPDALLNYSAAGNTYEIPAKKRKEFLKTFPDATESAWGQEESIQETAKAQDPFAPNAQYMDMSYANNIGRPEDYHYYPSPLNEEGRAEAAPMTAEERSKQEYDMLMNDLNQFNAANGQFMDTYEAYEKAARKQVNEGGIGIDTFERQYLDENSNDYRERKRQRDEINERIKGNSYFNQMRMAEADAASDMADGIAQIAMNERIDNHKLGLEYSLWQSQTNYGLRQGPGVHMPISKEALDFNAAQEDLQAAERLYRKTAEVYAAPVNDGEYILNRFVKGAGERANDLDFWTMGLSAIADDVNARQAFQKIQDKLGSVKGLADMSDAELNELLTPSEQVLIRAFMDNISAMAAREGNTSGAYKAGEGAADSAMFMAQFLLTAGVGDAATVGSAAHKRLVRWLGTKFDAMGSGLLKDAARGATKIAVGTAESIGRALVTTPLMPHTYVNIADNLMSFTDTGELTKVTDAIITGATDALIETWSESTGDFVNKVLGVPGGITKGIAKKVMKNVDFSDWGKAMNAPMMKIMRQGGFNGFLGEMGEEFIGNGVRSIIGSIAPGSGMDAEAFQKFAQLDNLLITAGSFAPMTVFGLGASSAQFGAQKRRLDNAVMAFQEELRKGGATEDQVAYAVDDMLASTDAHMTPEKLAARTSALIKELRANDRYASNFVNTASAANKLMWEIARYRTFDGVYQRKEEQQRADMQAEIMEGTGREFWTTRLSDQASLDGTAYEANEVQYVEFEDGRVAYVLGSDGVTNTVVYNDGTTGFLSNEQLNDGSADGTIVSHDTLSLDDYLTQQVARVRMTEEELRMSQERNEKLAQVKAAFPLEADVKMGTEEAPVMGKVKEVRLNGAFVEAADGTMRFLTWAELGNSIGVDINAKTDAEMDEEAINKLEIQDLQRRRERQQRRAERASQAEVEEEVVDEAENESIEHPVPMKADGSVDQDAFWNMSPERWAAWKTEQRQDGGTYAASYINNAINILAKEIAANEAAFQAESDFDAKDALEQVIARQQERMQSLQALATQYAPAVQQTQQVQPAAEQTQEGQQEQEKPMVLAQRQRDELNDEFKRRLAFARALTEKKMIFEEYFKTLASGSLPVNVVTKANYKEAMKEAKCSDAQIKRVTEAIKQAEENKEAVNALHVNGVVWLIADYNNSIEGARRAFVHERQHNITENNPELIQRVLALGLGKEKLAQIVKSLSGSEFYSNESEAVLADEILSFAIEYAYTYNDISVPLSRKGVPSEVINLINEISNEQREDQSLVNARRHENVRNNEQGNGGQNVGDQAEVSGGVLAPEGNGSVGDSVGGTEAGESGEPATGGAEASEEGLQVPVAEVEEESEEKPEGPDFRVTKPEDNLSDETKQELADKGLVMDGGAIMSEDYAKLKHETGYETPIERNTDLDDLRFSYGTRHAHIANYRQHPEAEKRVIALLERLAERISMNELVYGVMSTATNHKYVERGTGIYAGPLRENVEYVITFDLDTTCPRTFQYLNFVKRIEKRIRRPLTQTECIQLIEMMRMYGQQIPCVYCYAENKRQALKDGYTRFMNARYAVLSAETDEEALQHMYGRNDSGSTDPKEVLTKAAYKVFLQWRKDRKSLYNPSMKTLWSQYTFDRNCILSLLDTMYEQKGITTDAADVTITNSVAAELGVTSAKAKNVIEEIVGEWKWDTIEGKEHDDFTPIDEDDWGVNERAFEVWRDMTNYAKSMSSAKGVIRYTPYTDELKYVSQEDRDYVNGMGGVRMHSTNDFRIDYVFDYFQFMADMALYKMFGHTYTKSPEFVRIFGKSGYKINMSIAAYQDENGNIRPNADEGFDWEEAKALRTMFPNAGVMLMATSDEQIQMALDSDWIDMIIPFHNSGLPRSVWYNMRLWSDYQNIQKEKFYNTDYKTAALKADGVIVPKKAKADEIDKLYNEHFGIEVIYDKTGKRIAPHFLPGPTIVDGNEIPGHNNDHQTYLDLCRRYGVKPRFLGMQVKDNTPEGGGRVVDITEHPRYMILVKETARTDTPQKPIQFNFDEPSDALGGRTPLEYAFDELEARVMAESELEGEQVTDIYNSLKKDQFGIVDQFIDTIIKHKEETGKDYPLDYITPQSRKWFLVERKALEEAFKDVETIPYHRNEYDEQGNLIKGEGLEREEVIDLVEEAKKAQAKHDAKAKKGKKSDVSFRITPEQDKTYMDAVKAGDMETAQKMVNEAARLAMPNTKVVDKHGNPKIVMHLSSDEFTKFGEGVNTNVVHSLGFFTDELEGLKDYHDKFFPEGFAYKCFLNFENPKVVDFKGQPYWSYKDESTGEVLTTDLIAARTKREGKHDGLIMLNVGDELAGNIGDEINDFVPFIPSQIKSAEPVTYDNDGNAIPLSQRFNPENEDIRFRVRSEEEREKLFADAKAHYGVTNNFNAAGYMLPDGSLLDFSEANDGGDPNSRSLDHRDIEGIIMDNGVEYDSRWMYIADFMNEGAIRLLPESAGINMIQAPTEEQRKKIFDFIYKYNGEVILEINDERLNSIVYMEYDRRTSPSRIFRDIDGYFNDGIIPQQDVRFRMSNENQAIFVSNAARAVEGIKQEKATPEQWLKMIEKAGGLKAGEDKWMGLSDWLKASDKKTLTKAEVLEFIGEHMIVIEEQHYEEDVLDEEALWYKYEESEEGMDAINYQMQLDAEAYAERELADSDLEGEEWEQEYERLVSDYIEDDLFGSARSAAKDAVRNLWMEEEAPKLMKGASREINSTRINYTTEGLDNLHEIALTVPTIESWNGGDEIHFGDAGEGRAVAWIRFGETWEQRPSPQISRKVLVIDEIQSKRHQEGREKGYRTSIEDVAKATEAFQSFNRAMKEKYGENVFPSKWSEEDQAEFDRLKDEHARVSKSYDKGIPDAPFDKNWHELAMKRMLRYAAENGYDVIAWTKGEQQAERYNIGNVVRNITADGDWYDTNSTNPVDGKRARNLYIRLQNRGVLTYAVNEDGIIINGDYAGTPLANVVGKEMAVKLINAEPYEEFDAEDMHIGGEGMKGFYDKMLPAFMNKYGKKWGVKVEDIELPKLENGLTMHSVPVTEEMKASVMEGQVMFRMRGENESAMDFYESGLADYRRKYNELQQVEIFPVNEETAKRFGLTLDELKKTGGMYVEDEGLIAIFAQDEADDALVVENAIFHEQIHHLAHFYPYMDKLGEWLWNNTDKIRGFAQFKSFIEGNYDELMNQEMLCYVTSFAMTIGAVSDLEAMVPAEYRNTIRNIENEIGYDRRSEESSRQAERSLQQSAGAETHGEHEGSQNGEEPAGAGEARFRTTEITPEVQEEMDAIHASAIVMGNYMKALNGKDSNLTAEQWLMVRTKGFKAWFGDWENDPENASKVVDENGEPKVVYHGTAGVINSFEDQQRSPGFWFVDREDVANGYAESASAEFGEDKNVIPVFLNIRNPRTEDAHGEFPAEFALKSYVENDNGVYQEFDTYEEAEAYRKENVPDGWVGASKVGDQHDLVERAAEIGHDGVIMKNMHDQAAYAETRVQGTQTNYVVLSPSQVKSATDNTGEFSEGEGDIRFSIRTKPAPKNTGKGYKVFYLKDGKLYPPMVANLGGVDTPVGVWLDAEEGTRAGVSKTGRPQVKQGGKGTQGGSGTLAYRPGWHLGEIPYAIQFNRKDENGDRTLFPADFVWAEVEYANDVDYQEEAMSYGMNANGKFQHSLAGLPKLPTDGSYRYRTNPNPETDPWIITGAMKVNRLLTPSEVDQMVVDAGREPQKRQEGAVTDEQVEALNKDLGLVEEEEEVSFRTTGTPTEDVVAEGVSLSPAQLASLAGDIFAALPEDSRKKITDGLNGNILGLQDAILQIPTSLAIKENWNDEDRQMAEVIAEQMTKAVGIEMTRPFSASEALWTLYNAVNKSTDLVSEASRALVRRNLGFAENQGEIDRVKFSVRDSFETIDEIVNNGKQRVSDENAVSSAELFNRLSAINGELSKVRRAAAAQKAYDKATVKSVTALANDLLEKGALSDMTRGEIKRLLSVIKDAVGREDLATSVDRLMDIMITNQLRNMKGRLEQILKIRDKRVDQRGVEVKGKLDVKGQRIMAALREGLGLDNARLEERISETIDKMFDSSAVVSRNAENDLVGYKLARTYQEKIQESEREEQDLRKELKDAKELYDAGGMSREAYREFVKSIYEAIRENRMQRVTDYGNVIGDVTEMIVGSASAAKLFNDNEKARVERIHHYANSDMQGMPSVQQGKVDSAFWNSSIIRFLFKPLATFDQMLRSFAPKSRSGEGYLWNHFMGSWLKAAENEFKGTQEAHETLDRKVRSIFPGAKRWSDLFSIEKKLPMMDVKFWDGEKMADFKLTQGNLLYIYMVNKMSDGKMKLRKMGITEEDVQRIARELDPRFLELADWVQENFLPSLRDKYNAVHEKLFGAPMAAIDDYFPIRVLANARTREVDLGIEESSSKPSTITGSIIKRTRNSLALDILGSDAFDVVLEHIEQMEKWAAYAEFNQDLNTLLSYNKFRNRVQNMTGIYGAGPTVWNNFRTVAEIVAGVYKPAVKLDSLDKAITNAAKGVTGAKIAFRVYTALKQFLSAPAFVSDASPAELVKALANPAGAWEWAMNNLPLFEKRWKSRQAGDSRLMETESDWKVWKSKIVELAGRYGMTPNAFVDALTVSIGAKSIYETKLKQYIKDGYSKETAEEKAKRDATVLFNESQQSNEAAFLSAAQLDRTVASIAITVFRNSSMGYQRMYVDGLRNIKRMLKKGYKKESIEFMAKQMMRDGLTPEQAERAATRIYNRSFSKNAARVATFGFLVQFAWNLGPYMVYLLMGDDDEEKKDMLIDAAVRGLVGGPVEGLAAGQAISPVLGDIILGETVENPKLQLPAFSDLEQIFKQWNSDKVRAVNDIVNLVAQSLSGVNPQTIADAVVAIVDACNGDMETSKEVTLALMRILQTPQSQIEKLYMENIDFTAEETLDMTIKEFAERYAKYKVKRNAPLAWWAYSDEKEKELEDKYIKSFIKKAEEMQKTHGSEETKELLEYIDAEYDEVSKKIKDFKKEIREAAEKGESTDEMQKAFEDYVAGEEYGKYYDMSWDVEDFKAYKKALKDEKDPELRKEYADSMRAARDRALKRIKAEKQQ